ncbi:restriction endonuclease [Aquimarina sp. SS2-1]|uniref:restriction endonuclease n=1 Tax=Aquimarina besae TaxID=3342247 RepID=UPI003672917F
MSKADIPDFQTLMLPVLNILSDGSIKTKNELIKILADQYKLSEEDLKIKIPTGTMGLFRNRLGWTKSYLKNAGLIHYPSRGSYQITDEGRIFLQSNPKDLRLKQLKKMPKYKEWAGTFNTDTENKNTIVYSKERTEQTPDEILKETVEELNRQLAIDLLDKLKENSASYFEGFVVELLQKMGYGELREEAIQVTGQSGDNGIDGIIHQDRLGLESVYVQAKRFTTGTVGSPDIRNFIGSLALQGVTKGVFLTTSRFSSSAIQTANDSKQQKIKLIDGKELAQLAIEHNLGVQIADTILIKKIDQDYLDELS